VRLTLGLVADRSAHRSMEEYRERQEGGSLNLCVDAGFCEIFVSLRNGSLICFWETFEEEVKGITLN
jgi:hypothetical protein